MLSEKMAIADTAIQKTGSISIHLSKNVDMVVSSEGKKTGRNPLSKQNFDEIPGATYYTESGVADADLSDGSDDSTEPSKIFQNMKAPIGATYEIEIFSEKGGSFDLTAYLFGSNGEPIGIEKKKGKLSPKSKESIVIKLVEKSNSEKFKNSKAN